MDEQKPQLGSRVIFDKWVNGKLEGRYTGIVKGESHGVYRIEGDHGLRPDSTSAFFYLSADQFDILTALDAFVSGVFDERLRETTGRGHPPNPAP